MNLGNTNDKMNPIVDVGSIIPMDYVNAFPVVFCNQSHDHSITDSLIGLSSQLQRNNVSQEEVQQYTSETQPNESLFKAQKSQEEAISQYSDIPQDYFSQHDDNYRTLESRQEISQDPASELAVKSFKCYSSDTLLEKSLSNCTIL